MSILFEVKSAKKKKIGIALINRPQVLNALNLPMCREMAETFHQWAQDPEIAAIFIHGNGEKAFCAGGDVRTLREEMTKAQPQEFQKVIDFFCYEYLNDLQIHKIQKPILCWTHGITMGGGIGVMNGCAYRVVTENVLMAMPEISIGLFPDVGASHFLSRLAPGVGLYLGLTGARFSSHDALDLGLADHFIPEAKRGQFLDQLLKTEWQDDLGEVHNQIQAVISKFATPLRLPSTIKKLMDQLRPLDQTSDVVESLDILRNIGTKNAWVAESLERATAGSPTSLKVIQKLIQEGREMDVRECFLREFNLAIQFSLDHDFSEGVRAVLKDKDHRPHWQPSQLSEVSANKVDSLFLDPFIHRKDSRLLANESPFPKLLQKFQL